MKYENQIDVIVDSVGGLDNIAKVTHCFTRLRVTLKDYDKLDMEPVNALDIVKGSAVNSGQYQVIIGPGTVDEVCDEMQQITGIGPNGPVGSAAAQGAGAEGESEQKSPIERFIDIITGIFIPIFPALVAGGIMKGLLVALMFSGLVDTTTTTYGVLNFIADAPFYFLPFFIANTAAQKFGCNPVIAMVLAAIMLHPNFATLGDDIRLFGIPIPYVNYSSTVFPIILSVYMMSWVEKGVKRIVPKVVAGFFVPLLTVLVCAPIMLAVVGPVVNTAAMAVGNAFVWLIETAGVVAGIALGAIYPFLVFTGLHQAFPPIELQSIAQVGYDPMLAIFAASNAAIAGATVMGSFISKNADEKSLALTSGLTALLGITEPALYGFVSAHRNVFLATFVGGGVGGAIMGIFGVKAFSMGPVPLAAIAVFFGDQFVFYLLGIIAAFVAAAATVFVLGLDGKKK